MDIYSTKPIEEVDKLTFNNIKSNKEIIVSPHALDHLSEKQRKVFKEQDLRHITSLYSILFLPLTQVINSISLNI